MKNKKRLREMTTDELVEYGMKHHKRYKIAKFAKWGVCGAYLLSSIFIPDSALMPMFLATFSTINLCGVLQMTSSDDIEKCKKVLESRGELYKLTQKIEPNSVQEDQVGRRVSQVGKDEIQRDIGDVFPEFADNSSYTYRKDKTQNNVSQAQNNSSERGL